MSFSLTPAAAADWAFALAAADVTPRDPVDGFIQWQQEGVDLGDSRVSIIDFVGTRVRVSRGWGANAHVLTVDGTAEPSLMGVIELRNGFDGDVGVAGYIGASTPFEILEVVTQDYDLLTAEGEPVALSVELGAGDAADSPPSMGPLAVDESRSATEPADAEPGTFYSVHAYIPLGPGDRLWVVESTFEGSGQPWEVVVVAGPTSSAGKRFRITATTD